MRPLKTILHPTDFSRHSEHALELACALARDRGARLVVMHVVPERTAVVGGGDLAELRQAETCQEDLRNYRKEMRNKLAQLPLPGLVPGLPFRAERLLQEGNVVEAIVRTAQDTSCDLIVMGAHGRTEQGRRLMGSVAEEVMRRAPCPVVTVTVPPVTPKPADLLAEEAGVIV